MRDWIKPLRLKASLLTSFLAITSFVLAGISIPWIVVMAVFCITSTTMLQNDWRDRHHDIKKGKDLANKNPNKFLLLLLTFWVLSLSLVIIVTLDVTRLGVILATLTIVGAVYSETRKIPFAPIVLVSLASASPALLPLGTGVDYREVWLLFFSTMLIVFAREITKDLDDQQIDSGYKWTIPLVFGKKQSQILASITAVAGATLAVIISPTILLTAPLLIIAAIVIIRGAEPSTSRQYLDLGITLTLLTIVIFG